MGLDFLSARLSIFTCKIGPKCNTKVAHLLVAFCCLFQPHTHRNKGDVARGATAPEVEGEGSPPRRTVAARQLFLLCSSICTCKIGLNCSEILLAANSVWNFIAFKCSPALSLNCPTVLSRGSCVGQDWCFKGDKSLAATVLEA